ncbi:hypothetical protein RF55_21771 [Lasius niger]|uniref:Uncharacterized protein n=1 Tax=Lasius niger TaxID=67767 RepID=A0A0J7JXI2_LASNI|nr:hypothetical protein RF55_21771 [Lasius niger]
MSRKAQVEALFGVISSSSDEEPRPVEKPKPPRDSRARQTTSAGQLGTAVRCRSPPQSSHAAGATAAAEASSTVRPDCRTSAPTRWGHQVNHRNAQYWTVQLQATRAGLRRHPRSGPCNPGLHYCRLGATSASPDHGNSTRRAHRNRALPRRPNFPEIPGLHSHRTMAQPERPAPDDPPLRAKEGGGVTRHDMPC